MKKISGIQAGVSGEYFVAAELTRRGYIASITLRNTKGIDILASNQNATRSLSIQVKTHQGSGTSWILGEKAEKNVTPNLFYVFVSLNNLNELPSFYIVPSKNVALSIKKFHKEWLGTLGRNDQPHNDNPMRLFKDDKDKYYEKWELLGLDS